MSQTRRSGFTLMELLAVMLLIITVMGMGVPAMFAAERKSYVNQAMTELLRIHRICADTQREVSSRGLSAIITLTITSSTPTVRVDANDATVNDILSRRLGCTPTNPLSAMSINSDEFISQVAATSGSLSWSYDRFSGFISGNATTTLAFKALPSGANFKVIRTVTIFPSGYSEVP